MYIFARVSHLTLTILSLSFCFHVSSLAQETKPSPEKEAKVQANEPYQVMGKYQGTRTDGRSQREVTVNFQKFDYTSAGISLHIYFEPKKNERPLGGDHDIFTLNMNLAEFTQLFESANDITSPISLGPDHQISKTDVFVINTATTQTDKTNGQRTITISTTIGDRGDITRKYNTVITLVPSEARILAVRHEKHRARLFRGFAQVANFSCDNLQKKEEGLELRQGYGRITLPSSIQSAAEDSQPSNFERLMSIQDKHEQESKSK